MKKNHKIFALVLVLILLTAIAAWVHLSTRPAIAEGTLQITVNGKAHTVQLSALQTKPVSGERINGKGEVIPVSGQGVLLRDLLVQEKITVHTKVQVMADDSYTVVLTADEVAADGKAYLLRTDDELRLVVFGDRNSKRSVSNVVQIIIE